MESRTVNGLNMKSPDVYKTPEADLSENQQPAIGGWLRCFQVLVLISLTLNAIVLIAIPVFHLYVEGVYDKVADVIAITIEMLPSVVFMYLIARITPKAEAEVPAKIKNYLRYYLGAVVCIYFILLMAFNNDLIEEKPAPFIGLFIYYAIWASYFNKSTRVRAYYGANAN